MSCVILKVEATSEAPAEDPFVDVTNFGFSLKPSYLSATQILSSGPITVQIDLNELVRFKTAGEYEILMKSHRVSEFWNLGDGPIANYRVTDSNPLTITLVQPSPEWQHAESITAGKMLFDRRANRSAVKEAIRRLRYMNNSESAAQLIICLSDLSCNAATFEIEAALVQMTDKPGIIELLSKRERTLNDPQSVTRVHSSIALLLQFSNRR